jgi:hypothetical protein
MMKVYRITGTGLHSQIHCVVAKSIEEAARTWRAEYKSEPEGIELYSSYVLVAKEEER